MIKGTVRKAYQAGRFEEEFEHVRHGHYDSARDGIREHEAARAEQYCDKHIHGGPETQPALRLGVQHMNSSC